MMDSDLNMHMKFNMDPGTLFIKKNFVENPEFEAFKAEVKEEIVKNQKSMAAKQEEMSVDLKAI
ncbi:hypothetical protein A2U01_0104606, partial [Trifolium medium]|nr:hypothetical protein [Trifolium medium]